MIYIPFPRQDLNDHTDLVEWRRKRAAGQNVSWRELKPFLAQQPIIIENIHDDKCWFSECTLFDTNSEDVEHFRPKNEGKSISTEKIREIQALDRIFADNPNPELLVEQLENLSDGYPWLEFDYRNYRLVTALTNRGGAKHIYFSLAAHTEKLNDGEYPWAVVEYPLLLDPTNRHDANQLVVLPTGGIRPRAERKVLSAADYEGLPASWMNDNAGFNYLRAMVTIYLYRLNFVKFGRGRERIFRQTTRHLNSLLEAYKINSDYFIETCTEALVHSILPSAPFALAAKCAMVAYLVPEEESAEIKEQMARAIQSIFNAVDALVNAIEVNWGNG